MRSAGLALGVALVATPALASAQTQLLVGSKLVIKNPRQSDEANKMVFMSKDLNVATPVSTDEAPRCVPYGTGTASVTVSSTSGESFTLDLGGAKCVNWKGGVAGTRWKYRDPSGATS